MIPYIRRVFESIWNLELEEDYLVTNLVSFDGEKLKLINCFIRSKEAEDIFQTIKVKILLILN
jgi:hypothetical protein